MKRLGPKILSGVVIIAGVVVMTGWIFNIPALKSILPYWVAMKFNTAVCFVVSGLILLAIERCLQKKFTFAQIILPAGIFIILLMTSTIFLTTLFGIQTGVENLFISESDESLKSVTGLPSMGTVIGFLLVALAGILTEFRFRALLSTIAFIGWVMMVIGIIACCGYFLNQPAMFYYVKEVSSAMAAHTALLFVLLGAGFIGLKQYGEQT